MDDIDKVRDDLQSTKQMLALELRNKEAQERENKRLLAKIQNLEAELEKEKTKTGGGGGGGGASAVDDKVSYQKSVLFILRILFLQIIKSLKKEVDEARKTGVDLEKKYNHAAEELDCTKSQIEDLRRQNQILEKRLQESLQGKSSLNKPECAKVG